jgi:hypothetical protein
MAIQPSRLAVAFAALTVICLTGWLMDLGRTVLVSAQDPIPPANSLSSERTGTGVFGALANVAAREFQATTDSLLALDIRQFVLNLANSARRSAQALIWAFRYHTIYSVVFFAVALVALSMAGGVICRLSALQFARGERRGLMQGCRFAARKLASLVIAPIGPLVIAMLLGLPILLLGLAGNIPVVGELLTGLLLPLALILAPFIVIVLVGEAAGLGLMFPAVAYEDSDFFDAIGRSFSSVYAGPWRMGFYALVAALYGAACCLFVRFFAFTLLWVTRGFLQVGLRDEKLQAIWPQPGSADLLGITAAAPETWSLWLGALLVRIWILVIVGLTVSFVISFYFTANTIIYALMRNRVDGTGLDEVYEAPEEGGPESSDPKVAAGGMVEPTGTTSE